MWCPDDEYSSPIKRTNPSPVSVPSHSNLPTPTHIANLSQFDIPAIPQWTTHDDDIIFTPPTNPTLFRAPLPPVFPTVSHLRRGSPSPAVPVHPDTPRPLTHKRPTPNWGNHSHPESKMKKQDDDGVNQVIRPILPYVDLMKEESREPPLCDKHLSVQKAVKARPELIDMDEMDRLFGKNDERNPIFQDGSEVDVNAPFMSGSTAKIDENLFSRDKMKRKKTIEELIDEMSSCESPSPFLISSFSSSLSSLIVEMNSDDRRSFLSNLRSSLLTSPSVSSTARKETRATEGQGEKGKKDGDAE